MQPVGPETGGKQTVDLPPQGRYGFVGREEELAAALIEPSVVLLTGPPGVGKTELACELARRQAAGDDRQGVILYTSFEYGAGLCRLLHEVGTTLRGIGFARLSLDQQRQWVLDYVKQHPCLLVWDNFERVFDYLDRGECQELMEFLKDIHPGPTCVLITGQSAGWIEGAGIGYRRQELGPLKEGDARDLAREVLASSETGEAEAGPGYAELLRLLRGNPMATRAMLPHLKQHSAADLVLSLNGPGEAGPGEWEIMDAALDCSFSLLSPRTRSHLPFLAVLRQRVLLDVVTFITQGEVYRKVMGEEMGWGACRSFLREARDSGILDSVSPSAYVIPPSVAPTLSRQLRRRLGVDQIEALEREFVQVYAGMGEYFLENLSSESAQTTVTGVLAEEANLLRALEMAVAAEQWDSAQLLLQPLAQVYKMQDRVLELRRIKDSLLSRLGSEGAQTERRDATELWMYVQMTDASEAIQRGEMDRAESICSSVLGYLESSRDPADQPRIASACHLLGLAAQGRGNAPEAEGWYGKALNINEPLKNEAECADIYHQLGLLAQLGQSYEDAETWHRRAVEIRERLGDEAESASEYHQLALVVEARSRPEEALELYHRARAVYEHLGDKAGEAAIFHRLGLMSQARFDYEEAMGWYQRALLVYEELGDEAAAAGDYYQVGVIALRRYEYDEAEALLRQALAAYERLGDAAGVANSYHQLGVAAHAQGRHNEAEELYHRALDLLVRVEGDVAAASTWGQLGLLADQRRNYPHAVWYVAHTYEIAAAHGLPLLQAAKAHLSSLRYRMGDDAFIRCWKEVSDTDVLGELE